MIVGLLDERDSLSARARALMERFEEQGRQPVFADFLIAEALSALCRRAFERKAAVSNLDAIIEWIQEQRHLGLVFFPELTDDVFSQSLAIVKASRGELNFNDARLVVMQRSGMIGEVASFDADFAAVEGFRLIS